MMLKLRVGKGNDKLEHIWLHTVVHLFVYGYPHSNLLWRSFDHLAKRNIPLRANDASQISGRRYMVFCSSVWMPFVNDSWDPDLTVKLTAEAPV